MALLVLGLVWVIVLVPIALRKNAERRLGSPLGMFSSLAVRLKATMSVPKLLAQPVLPVAEQRSPMTNEERALAARRERARLQRRFARRRQIVARFCAATVALVVVGIIPPLHVMLYLAAMVGLLTGAYLALVAHVARIERLADERARKVVQLPLSSGGTQAPSVGYAVMGGPAPMPIRPSFVIVDKPS